MSPKELHIGSRSMMQQKTRKKPVGLVNTIWVETSLKLCSSHMSLLIRQMSPHQGCLGRSGWFKWMSSSFLTLLCVIFLSWKDLLATERSILSFQQEYYSSIDIKPSEASGPPWIDDLVPGQKYLDQENNFDAGVFYTCQGSAIKPSVV